MGRRRRPPRKEWASAQPGFRDQVRARSRGICENKGCREPAEHIHHLSYDRVPNETLFDVLFLCKRCHQNCHPRYNMYGPSLRKIKKIKKRRRRWAKQQRESR